MVNEKINYDGPVSNPTSDLTTTKLYWNIVIYPVDRRHLIVYVKNFHLKNSMKKDKYYKISIKLITKYIIDNYDLNNKQSNGYIYFRVKKGIYSLVQAGIITHKAIK